MRSESVVVLLAACSPKRRTEAITRATRFAPRFLTRVNANGAFAVDRFTSTGPGSFGRSVFSESIYAFSGAGTNQRPFAGRIGQATEGGDAFARAGMRIRNRRRVLVFATILDAARHYPCAQPHCGRMARGAWPAPDDEHTDQRLYGKRRPFWQPAHSIRRRLSIAWQSCRQTSRHGCPGFSGSCC